ncbi:MAG TPA: chemotaxis protein CheB [Myxococcota bacterium]|nr:chemotaxis protein CheB [Myxococcota bacterium]
MRHHDVVALGGSFGAIDAVQKVISELPADFAAAVLVAIHLGADSPGAMGRILGVGARLPVSLAVDATHMQHGHVYVAPANHHLLLIGDTIRLGKGPRENRSRPAVDPLFRSVAMSAGSRAIGVVMTGLLDDGASGLADIKRFGGYTVVQAPSDAIAPDMPLAAMRATDVDHSVPAAELARLLVELVARPAGGSTAITDRIRLEVKIAMGSSVTAATIAEIAGESLLVSKETSVDEALRVALRIVEERAVLSEKMAAQARRNGHASSAQGYDERSKEHRLHAEVLRKAALASNSDA